MGAKSTNITNQQMLPLFQVISDLEKPYESSVSLATNFSNIYLNNKSILDNDDIVIHHYSKSDNISSGDLVHNRCIEARYAQNTRRLPLMYGKYLDTGNNRHRYTSRNRRKYRRRLKTELGTMDEISFKFNGKHHSDKRKNGSKGKTPHQKKIPSIKYSEATTNTDNSSPLYDNKTQKKRIGLFTEMGLSAYKDEDIDISRHFKNITKEDLVHSETEHGTTGVDHSDPIYEVPKNMRKRHKKKHEGDVVNSDVSMANVANVISNRSTISSKKIVQKYEEMLAALMERNQNKDIVVQEKDMHITKMKSKLKELLSINNQFADENEYMKRQHGDMKMCIEQYKTLVKSLEERVEKRELEIENCKGKCNNCNDKEIIAMKAERQSVQLTEDLLMLKNVVYRLNVQLSRYQDKLRNLKRTTKEPKRSAEVQNVEPSENMTTPNLPVIEEVEDVSMPPLPNFEQDKKGENTSDAEKRLHFIHQDTYSIEPEAEMVWGDVNTHTLAPLLNAYQESIVEKDQLIRDYECEFNRFTTKLKYLVDENNDMHSAVTKLANELSVFKEKCGLATTERDALRRDCQVLKEKVDVLTNKLSEVHALYEQKVDTMSRDYTVMHEEYFKCKSSLSSTQTQCQMLEEQCTGLKNQEVVPSNIHQNRIEECRRLFEELKIRYENDKERLNTRINLLQQSNELTEKKIVDVMCEKQKLENKYKHYDHIIGKHRREIQVLRNELQMTKSARDAARRRAGHATSLCKQMAVELKKGEQRNQAQKVKTEKIKETFKELDAVENLLKEKDKVMHTMKEENEQEITRLKEILRENSATIEAMRKHINQERVKRYGSLQRLDTTNLHDNIANLKLSSDDMPRPKSSSNLPSANIIPVKGGYFLHRDRHKSGG